MVAQVSLMPLSGSLTVLGETTSGIQIASVLFKKFKCRGVWVVQSVKWILDQVMTSGS